MLALVLAPALALVLVLACLAVVALVLERARWAVGDPQAVRMHAPVLPMPRAPTPMARMPRAVRRELLPPQSSKGRTRAVAAATALHRRH